MTEAMTMTDAMTMTQDPQIARRLTEIHQARTTMHAVHEAQRAVEALEAVLAGWASTMALREAGARSGDSTAARAA
jgi:hypothetical protein